MLNFSGPRVKKCKNVEGDVRPGNKVDLLGTFIGTSLRYLIHLLTHWIVEVIRIYSNERKWLLLQFLCTKTQTNFVETYLLYLHPISFPIHLKDYTRLTKTHADKTDSLQCDMT